MSAEKRKRSPNWLLAEKMLLTELVEKHLDIVENKKTDGFTIKQKLAEWKIIAQEYNSQTIHCSRLAENLKNQWDYMKKNAKKEESYRKHRNQTGGGPENPKKEDPIHSKIISLIKTSSVPQEKLENKYFAEVQDLENDIDVIQKAEVDSNEAVIQDWSDYTSKLLKTPVSAPLQISNDEQERKLKTSWISRRRPTYMASSSSLQELHENKDIAIDFQKQVTEHDPLHFTETQELDLQIKREQLKQEKLKTCILLMELKLKKKQLLNTQ